MSNSESTSGIPAAVLGCVSNVLGEKQNGCAVV